MKEYIKKLQSKDEFARKQILTGVMTLSMIIVGVVWVYSFGHVFNEKNKEVAESDNTIKPLTIFKNSISDTYKNISASVGKISEGKKELDKARAEEKQIDLIPVEYINQ